MWWTGDIEDEFEHHPAVRYNYCSQTAADWAKQAGRHMRFEGPIFIFMLESHTSASDSNRPVLKKGRVV